MSEPELWTLEEAAEFLGIRPVSARSRLHRRGVRAVARRAGRGGQNVYRASEVRAAAGGPGKGARTDLRREEEL